MRGFVLCLIFFCSGILSGNGQIKLACSSSLYLPLQEWIKDQEIKGIDLIPGASRNLYHQQVHGANFDLFFCADPKVTELLGGEPDVKVNEVAISFVALWVKDGIEGFDPLSSSYKGLRVGLADPRTAPFGAKAEEFLQDRSTPFEGSKVFGDGVSQVDQFIYSGSVDVAFCSNAVFGNIYIRPGKLYLLDDYSLSISFIQLEGVPDQVADLFLNNKFQAHLAKYKYKLP